MGGGYVRDIVLQAEEVALVVAGLQRRCTQDARLAGGGQRRDFGRTPRTCCSRGLHRTPESLTKKSGTPRRPTPTLDILFPSVRYLSTDSATRGTSVRPTRASFAQDLGSPGGTQCCSWLAYGTADGAEWRTGWTGAACWRRTHRCKLFCCSTRLLLHLL